MQPKLKSPLSKAAQQVWGDLTPGQQSLTGMGAGLYSLYRNDLGSPAVGLMQSLGAAPPGAREAYDRYTEGQEAPYSSLPGIVPPLLKGIGEGVGMLPGGALLDPAIEAITARTGLGALASGPGVAGYAARVAPQMAGGAALGALSPEDRGLGAGIGATIPALAGIPGAAVVPAAKAAMHLGAPIPLMERLLLDIPAAVRGMADKVAQSTPDWLAQALTVPADVGHHLITHGIKAQLKGVLPRVLRHAKVGAAQATATNLSANAKQK